MNDSKIKEICEKWIETAKSTGPYNVPEAEAAILALYDVLEVPRPKAIHHMLSPLAGASLQKKLSGDIYEGRVWGVYDAGWCAWLDVSKNEEDEVFKARKALAEAKVGMCWLNEECAILTRLPDVLSLDAEGHLHCADGPALVYADGWEEFFWHGTIVPSDWIMEGSLTPQKALSVADPKLKLAACEILGWARVIKHLPYKVRKVLTEGIVIDVQGTPKTSFLVKASGEVSPIEKRSVERNFYVV